MKTVDDFRTAINEELDKQAALAPELSGLSTSTAAEWVGLREVFASLAFTIVAFWEAFKNEILNLIEGNQYGTQAWWKQTMLNYQDGDALPEGKVKYATIDLSKRIITRTSITKNSNGTVLIKVAKSTGALAGTISDGEFSRVNDYITDIKPFCSDHQLISLAADEMRCILNIRYDGKLVKAIVEAAVESAINSYLANVKFDGVFNINRFRDAIEAITGVIDVDVALVQIRPNGEAFTTVLREYQPKSGYYNWLPTSGLDASTINMIAA